MQARHDRIQMNPEVMLGKPVIKGTRVTVEQILRKLAAGMSPEEIVGELPTITVADIHAAEAFAADYLADQEIAFG